MSNPVRNVISMTLILTLVVALGTPATADTVRQSVRNLLTSSPSISSLGTTQPPSTSKHGLDGGGLSGCEQLSTIGRATSQVIAHKAMLSCLEPESQARLSTGLGGL